MFYEDRVRLIGHRIKENRTRLNLTQKELLERVFLSEKSVASLRKWENGERLPDLETMARMCDVFGCDLGYLLGDYNEANFSAHKICEYTGLSEAAVKTLYELKHDPYGIFGHAIGVQAKGYFLPSVGIVNELIEAQDFIEMLNDISLFLIYGGLLPQDAYAADEESSDLIKSEEEFNRFVLWANGQGLELAERSIIYEMFLLRASDKLKNIFCDVLKKELRKKEAAQWLTSKSAGTRTVSWSPTPSGFTGAGEQTESN